MKKAILLPLRTAVAWVRHRLGPPAIVLLYHRVTELETDPKLLAVDPRRFAEHLEIIRKYAHPISLGQLAEGLRDGKIPARAVAVTFDDGYRDNLDQAKPLLERFDIPATVFIASGFIDQDREFWWDQLERILLQPGTLPQTLRLNVGESTCQWELNGAADYSDRDYQRNRRWNCLDEYDHGPRQKLYRTLGQMVKTLPEPEQRAVLDKVLDWAGQESAARATHKVLSSDQVISLAEGGLVEIGGHTVTHPVLSTLSEAAQRDEIERGKRRLEDILGRQVRCFAYPYGARSDYTTHTAKLVERAKFGYACSNFPDRLGRRADMFQLPRVLIRDWPGDEFARRLEGWFRV